MGWNGQAGGSTQILIFTQQYENRKVMNNNFTLNIVSHLNKDLSL